MYANRPDTELGQQLAELRTLSVLGRSLSSSLELSEVLNQIVDAATTLTHAEEGLLLLPDEAGAALYIRAMKGLDNESASNFRIKTEDTLAGQVFKTGTPVLVGAQGWQKVKTEYFVRSLLYVPLTYKEGVIGVLGVNNKRAERPFTAHDQELLLDLASHAATALANARLYEQQVAQTRQLATLVEAGRAVNSTLALAGVLSSICGQIVHALDVSGCLISELVPGGDDLRALASAVRSSWRLNQGPELDLVERPILKSALEQNVYYLIAPEEMKPGWESERDYIAWHGAGQALVLPLRPGGQPIGVLELNYIGGAPDTDTDFRRKARTLAVEIAAQAADRRPGASDEPSFALANRILAQTGADWCTVWLLNSEHSTLTRVLDCGHAVWSGALRPQYPIFPVNLDKMPDETPLAYTARDERLPSVVRKVFANYDAEALLCVRLAAKGKPLGAVLLYDVREPRHFSLQEISLVQAMVAQAATAIENARLFSDLADSLTPLKATQVKLVQAARLSAIGELAAVVAHQIDNPLTAVLGNAELIMQDMPQTDPFYESVLTIHRAGKRAHAVGNRLLSMARQGENTNEVARIDVNMTIRAVLELVTAYIQRDRVTLRIDLSELPLWMAAPPGQLEDVWLNLLLNARYAVLGVPKATVGIHSGWIDDRITVAVWDNGRGISPEHQARIFEAFFTTKPMGEGTGLGLYICKQVIDNVGGALTVQSAPEAGTRFTVTLPPIADT